MRLKREQSAADIAEVFGVNPETVGSWGKDGCPSSRRGRRVYFNDGEVQAWLTANKRSTRPGRPPKEKPETNKEDDKDYWLARKYRIQCLREEGQVVGIEDIEQWISEHVGTAKNKLNGLGASISPQLEGRDTAERQTIIEKRVREILEELSAEARRIGDGIGVEAAA